MPMNLALEKGQVHIWTASLDQPGPDPLMFPWILSPDERDRADRFVREDDRKRFMACRGILRILLGRYLNIPAGAVTFAYGAAGKPMLAPSFGNSAPRFNVAHSAGLALYAFSRDHEVGADIERVRAFPNLDNVAERSFSRKEMRVFGALPEGEDRTRAFYNGWTRKEAVVKALGDGLSRPLDSIEVSLAEGRPARLIAMEGEEKEARKWSLLDVRPAPDYAGALAVKSTEFDVIRWAWGSEFPGRGMRSQ